MAMNTHKTHFQSDRNQISGNNRLTLPINKSLLSGETSSELCKEGYFGLIEYSMLMAIETFAASAALPYMYFLFLPLAI